MTPIVSVVMPVFNAENYLTDCMKSILNQTYDNFEFIIIDDNSTDNSTNIITSFNDPRIKLKRKNKRSGYVDSLNYGVSIAKGSYIARMDADDISISTRFEKQVSFLKSHAEVCAIATKISMINENNIGIGLWKNDSLTTSDSDIIKYLPGGNCLAHPSMMIRKEIFRNYKYDIDQYGSEDWDLWLTLISDGYKISKLNEVLLLYRKNSNSVSALIDNKTGVKKKAINVQKKYLIKRVVGLKFTLFDLKVFFFFLKNILKVRIYPLLVRANFSS